MVRMVPYRLVGARLKKCLHPWEANKSQAEVCKRPQGLDLQLCPTPGHLMVSWRPGEAYKPQGLAPTEKSGGGSVMMLGGFSKAGHLSLWRAHESSRVQGCPGRTDNVPERWRLFFPAGQCSMPHSQVNQGVDEGSPDQDSEISRLKISVIATNIDFWTLPKLKR